MKPQLLLVMACGLLAACGPTIPIDAGLKTSGADILFGRPPASPAPPPIVVPVVPGFPAPIEMPPLPPLPVPPTPPPPACPSASPLDYPALQAPPAPPAPPVAATYAFRYTGTDTIDPGKPDQKIVLENGNGTRQVTNIQTIPAANAAQAAHYTFDVIETYQGWQQTNSYDIEPSGPSQATAVGISPAAGIYLTRMTIQPTGAGQRSPQDFRPSTPVQISTFPEAPGATFEGGGSDGSTTMEITPNTVDPNSGIVKGRVNVDACGKVLQAWQNLLDGRIVTTAGPGPQEVFALELDFGTQYGGLSLQDHLVLDTTPQTGLPDRLDLTTTINEEPQVPQP